MRLTLSLLGLELDVTLGPADAPSPAPDMDPLRDLGATGGTFLSFTSSHDLPDEAAIHRPCSPWEDDSEC